ncbi:S8 family serine peptidase [Moheibacter sediminis]|uniref:Subtilase family protein n=1 Tax=Moheibacter sediminis TaxID=1434700 RepID=A0A1W2AIZ4_9FLAO|nr:S8 family serine peptidase [Moheibacter sediminis]SMC60656.1 Subtilase family protein [Moheibacter sediminis]
MNKFWITLGLAFTLSVSGLAQTAAEKTQEVWYNSDKEATGIYGVNTEKAWQFLKEHNRKPKEFIVAVLDGGIQADHVDLQANMWVNPKEKAGNGKDDDKNGYIDDIHGWNFIGGADGKNVDGDTLEKVRVFKYEYIPLFASPDTAKNEANKSKYPEKFADYEAIEAEIAAKLAEAKGTLPQIIKMKDGVDKGFKVLINDFKETIVTEETLGKYNPSQEAMGAMMAFGMMEKSDWSGKTMQQIYDFIGGELTSYVEYFEGRINAHYNVEFESRGIVGDNYADKKEKIYGNADVEGPDAGHGTHVAGLIAAVRGNNQGIDGIAGNHIKIIGVRTVPNGDERDKDVANSIRYAVDNGAKILNMSFGKSHSPERDIVWEAMKYAEKKGALLIKAAGNDNVNIDEEVHYPTNFDDKGNKVIESLLTIGASTEDPLLLKASFSNYGKKSVDVFAPGANIMSTVPHDKYKAEDGTSMASPVTAGVAALIWSHYPNLTAVQVKDIIMQSVNKDPQLADISVTGGVVDAYKAVQLAEQMSSKKK